MSPHFTLMSPDSNRDQSLNFFMSNRMTQQTTYQNGNQTDRQLNRDTSRYGINDQTDMENQQNDIDGINFQLSSRSQRNQTMQNQQNNYRGQNRRQQQQQNDSQCIEQQMFNNYQHQQIQGQIPHQLQGLYTYDQLEKQKKSKKLFQIIFLVLLILMLINTVFITTFYFNKINDNVLIITGTCLFLLALIMQFYICIFNVCFCLKDFLYQRFFCKLGSYFQLVEIFAMGIFLILIHFNLQQRTSPLIVYIFYWPFLHIMAWVSANMKFDNSVENEDQQFVYLLFGFRCLVFVQVMMILLKLDMYVDFSWYSIFIPTLLFLGFTTIVCIQTFVQFLTSICKKTEKDINKVGITWESITLISSYICSWISLIGLLLNLESKQDRTIKIGLSINIGTCFFILLFTIKNYKKLMQLEAALIFYKITALILQIKLIIQTILYNQRYFLSDCNTPDQIISNLNLFQYPQQMQQNDEQNYTQQQRIQQEQNIQQESITQQNNQQNQNDDSTQFNPPKQFIQQITKFFKKFQERPPSYLIRMSSTYFKTTYADKKQLIQDKKKQKAEAEKQLKQLETKDIVVKTLHEETKDKPQQARIKSDNQLDKLEQKQSKKESDNKQNPLQSNKTNQSESQIQRNKKKYEVIDLSTNQIPATKPINQMQDNTTECDKNDGNKETLNISTLSSKADQSWHKDKKDLTCVICFESQPNSVFMNCGHGGICKQCALDVSMKTGLCFLCREPIKQIIRVKDASTSKKYQEIESITYLDGVQDTK